MKLNTILKADNVLAEIEEAVTKHKIGYIDAIVDYCERRGIEVEAVAAVIKGNSKIKARLQEQAEELNYLPKRAKLPIGD
jgi:hypothetical protein